MVSASDGDFLMTTATSTLQTLIAKFHAHLGFYPIFEIDEFCGGDYDYRDYYSGYLDSTKLDSIDEGTLGYVQHIFQDALKQLQRSTTKDRLVCVLASRKYSFGDTHDWWATAEIKQEDVDLDRVIKIELEVHS
jgi:hypothetical protein